MQFLHSLLRAESVFTKGGVNNEFLLNLLFYVIITPVISTTLTKIMFMSEDSMIAADAIKRIDSVLNAAPLSEPKSPKTPYDNSVALENVSYSYDGVKDAIHNISLTIPPGQTTAFLGCPLPAAAKLHLPILYQDFLTRKAAGFLSEVSI